MKFIIACTLVGLLLAIPIQAEDFASLNEQGNEAYEEGQFKEALDLYHEAEIEKPETPEIYYNQANALVKTGKYEQAIEKYSKALNSTDIKLQADAYYNQGNGYFMKEDFVNAINAYEQCLNINPDDVDAKFNLELARNRLKEQMERQEQDKQDQQQEQQQDEQQQEEQKQDEQQQEEKSEEEKQQEQQEQEQQGGEEDKDNEEQGEKPPPPPESQEQQMEEMSKEDAERLLNSLEDMEAQNQKRKYKIQGTYQGEDW